MSVEIKVPELGESVVEATVGRWLKQPGDPVSIGEAVVELETDKVNLEVGADHDGVLSRIDHQPGDDVRVGDILGLIDESAREQEKEAKTGVSPASKQAASKQAVQAEPEREPEREPVREPQPGAVPAEPARAEAQVTPVARRLAESSGVDLSRVSPSGVGGRVTKEDVQRYLDVKRKTSEIRPPVLPTLPTTPGAPAAAASAPQPPGPVSVDGSFRREERIRMSRRRRTIASRLVEAQRTAAMLTTFNEIDMTAVMALREQRKDAFREQHGIGLGISSFFVKAAIGALRKFPRINAEMQGDDIVIKHYYDVGVAIGAPDGLVVPVLRNADRMSFADIETAIKRFAEQARENTLALEDLRGGTFTITNGGVFGSLMSTPILNPPQVGILGLHKIEQRPVVYQGQIAIRSMMYVALSYDHRVVDGQESVQFLVRVKELMEDPTTLLIEG